MKAEIESSISEIQKSLNLIRQRMKWETSKARLEELTERTKDPNLWSNSSTAQSLMKERQILLDSISSYENLAQTLDDNLELLSLAYSEKDTSLVTEIENVLKDLQKSTYEKENEALLNEATDKNDTFVEINAGAGGTESCDWAAMLARMYSRWADKRNYVVEIISENPGDEAGLKSITYKIKGLNAYGWLKTESGVHRLVRISPFDSAARRHTSFSSVWVYPVVDDNIDIEIVNSDIRIDTFRSSGAGGQHVNTTDSAVRITHLPTGIVVTSSEKSQHQNRAICISALKSRLYDLEIRKRNSVVQEFHDNKGEAGWGNQIRSYVLQPYQMIKDLRTNYETSNSQSVLDGDLDKFMAAALALDVTGKSPSDVKSTT